MDDKEFVRLVRSFLWCIVHQQEKVPGQIRHLIETIHPDLTEEQRYDVSEQIIKILTWYGN